MAELSTMSNRITGRTKIVGVIGHPVGHSKSPLMHNAAFRALGLDYCYVAFNVEPTAVPDALKGMKAFGIVGLNVTIPHKPAVYEQMDRLAPSAQVVEAVNTIQFRDGLLVGHNTDGEGFARSIEMAGAPIQGQEVTLIGAGGASRSIAAACLDRGAARLTILNRTPERARELAERLQHLQSHIPISWGSLDEGEDAVQSAGILVQCTSVGMSPHEEEPPPIPVEWLRPDIVVYDLIYNPRETRLLSAARSVGARVFNGMEMLVYQGAVAFEIWTGVFPPLDVMRQALS